MQAHAEKIIVDTISTQINNVKENADVYKSVHGETAYNKLLVSLISKMTGGTMKNSGSTPSSGLASTNGKQISLLDDDDEDEYRGPIGGGTSIS
jgi:hypothetical protein